MDAVGVGDPFKIPGPAMISFSGGRTSGLMLRRCLDAGLEPDVHVLFANTGKEREETLAFVRECEIRWSVPIVWLERALTNKTEPREVSFETASRAGEPFDYLITMRKYLPNPVTRFCTQDLKIRVMKQWMLGRGYEHWTNVVGIRADEPRRVARMRDGEGKGGASRWDIELPLADAGVTVADVAAFWRRAGFDLALRTWEGNCDLCFLKGRAKRERIMRDRPDLAAWWAAKEVDALFRIDAPPYSVLAKLAEQPMLPFDPDTLDAPDDLGDCVCTD